jgi:hypothetical protein
MTALLLGQVLGTSIACGLNLYLTVAALGILSRVGVLDVPPGLRGLEGLIVIASATLLFLVDAVGARIRHADSLWDTVHTFVRPPAASLLALGAAWGRPLPVMILAAALGFLVALATHGTKAGLRLALHAAFRRGHRWVSAGEDVIAVAFAAAAFASPSLALGAAVTLVILMLLFGPAYWRAFRLGVRGLAAWGRSLFSPARWREAEELPRPVRRVLDPTPLGGAPPRGARAAVHGLPQVGPYRNGWLVVTPDGPIFVYRSLFRIRRAPLPTAADVSVEPGLWADSVDVHPSDGTDYTIYILKDGPALEIAITDLQHRGS